MSKTNQYVMYINPINMSLLVTSLQWHITYSNKTGSQKFYSHAWISIREEQGKRKSFNLYEKWNTIYNFFKSFTRFWLAIKSNSLKSKGFHSYMSHLFVTFWFIHILLPKNVLGLIFHFTVKNCFIPIHQLPLTCLLKIITY